VFRKRNIERYVFHLFWFSCNLQHTIVKLCFEIGKTNVLQNSSKKQEEAKVLNVLRYEEM
jgi:hypothetical protein